MHHNTADIPLLSISHMPDTHTHHTCSPWIITMFIINTNVVNSTLSTLHHHPQHVSETRIHCLLRARTSVVKLKVRDVCDSIYAHVYVCVFVRIHVRCKMYTVNPPCLYAYVNEYKIRNFHECTYKWTILGSWLPIYISLRVQLYWSLNWFRYQGIGIPSVPWQPERGGGEFGSKRIIILILN